METNFKHIEHNAQNAPVKDIEWQGQTVETPTTPLMNDDTGKPIILRQFEFQLPPLKAEEMPTAEQFIAVHKTKIMGFLWRDELVPIQEFKCIFSKDNTHAKILVTCQAKAGSTILERPTTIQHTLHNEHTQRNTR